MTFCPGKIQPAARSGNWCRSLPLDLAAIEEWGAAVIVNLIEDHEMVALAVEDTPDHVPEGIEYMRMPIPDVGIPDHAWEEQWKLVGPRLCSRLKYGQAVLLHCKGGLGRAGMVAARLLIELGWSADDAISSVRSVRPGAIETFEQEQYVRNLAPSNPSQRPAHEN